MSGEPGCRVALTAASPLMSSVRSATTGLPGSDRTWMLWGPGGTPSEPFTSTGTEVPAGTVMLTGSAASAAAGSVG